LPAALFSIIADTPIWVPLIIVGLFCVSSVWADERKRYPNPGDPPLAVTWLTLKWMVALVLLTILSGIGNGSSADGDVQPVPAVQAPADPPPPDLPSGLYDLAEVDVQPELRNREAVDRVLAAGYPPLLRDAGVTGTVTVGFTVDTLGVPWPGPMTVESATDEAFIPPALEAARAMRFRPAQKDGRNVAVQVTHPVAFTLQEAP
jgi:TonB family protein